MIRTWLRGDANELGGFQVRLRDSGQPVPIFLAAGGPKNLALAGEIADGVILATGTSNTLLADIVPIVHQGAEAVGRDRETIELVVAAYGGVETDQDRAARLMKPVCLHFAQTGQRHILDRVGIAAVSQDETWRTYPDLLHAERWEDAIAEADVAVSDDDARRYVEEFCLYGSPDDLVRRLTEMARFGVTEVCFRHQDLYSLPTALIQEVGDALATTRSEESS